MATVSKVVTIDFLNKRSVVLIRDETFRQLAAKVSGAVINNSNQTLKIECSDNGHQWSLLDGDVVMLSAIPVSTAGCCVMLNTSFASASMIIMLDFNLAVCYYQRFHSSDSFSRPLKKYRDQDTWVIQ